MSTLLTSDVVAIEPVTDLDRWRAIDAMLRDYVPWVMREMEATCGVRFEGIEQEAERHHVAFAQEARAMMQGHGFVLLARLRNVPAAVVALKRIDSDVAEVKRLYVRPEARGHGVGRELMERVVQRARRSGYRSLRLETMSFMTAAISIYESIGFRQVPPFDGSQSAMSGVAGFARFMRLDL